MRENKKNILQYLLKIACEIEDDQIDPIIGTRLLVEGIPKIEGLDTEKYKFIYIFENETGDIPIDSMRSLYSMTYLEKIDNERNEYLCRVKTKLKDSCRLLIKDLREIENQR